MLLFISFHLCRFHSVISVSVSWNFQSRLKNLENSLTFTILTLLLRWSPYYLPSSTEKEYLQLSIGYGQSQPHQACSVLKWPKCISFCGTYLTWDYLEGGVTSAIAPHSAEGKDMIPVSESWKEIRATWMLYNSAFEISNKNFWRRECFGFALRHKTWG